MRLTLTTGLIISASERSVATSELFARARGRKPRDSNRPQGRSGCAFNTPRVLNMPGVSICPMTADELGNEEPEEHQRPNRDRDVPEAAARQLRKQDEQRKHREHETRRADVPRLAREQQPVERHPYRVRGPQQEHGGDCPRQAKREKEDDLRSNHRGLRRIFEPATPRLTAIPFHGAVSVLNQCSRSMRRKAS